MNDKEVVKIALKKEIDFLTLKCYNEGITLEEQRRASMLMNELSRRGKKARPSRNSR